MRKCLPDSLEYRREACTLLADNQDVYATLQYPHGLPLLSQCV